MCFCTKTFCSFLSTDSSVSWSVVAVLALLDVFSVCQSVVPRWGEAWARSGLCCPFLWECGGGDSPLGGVSQAAGQVGDPPRLCALLRPRPRVSWKPRGIWTGRCASSSQGHRVA